MDSFLIIVWNAENAAGTERADALARRLQGRSGWYSAYGTRGVAVLIQSHDGRRTPCTTLGDERGFIVGDVFRSGNERAGTLQHLDAAETTRLIETRGEALVQSCWGRYVAIWRDPSGDVSILRDPSGALPCYRIAVDDIILLFSHPAAVLSSLSLRVTFDWSFLIGYASDNARMARATGFAEVTELLPGERLTVARTGKHASAFAWSAVEIARRPHRESFAATAQSFRRRLEICLDAVTTRYDAIAVRLSGGLDSSILTGALALNPRVRTTALHMTGVSYEAYEDELARIVARRASVDVREVRIDPRETDLGQIVEAPLLARPSRHVLGLHAERQISEACRATRVGCVLAGHGGDAVFMQLALGRYALADYLIERGPGPRLLTAGYDTAMLQQLSLAQVLSDAFTWVRRHRTSSSADASPSANFLLTKGSSACVRPEDVAHPLLLATSDLPPAKRSQVRSLLALPGYNTVITSDPGIDSANPFSFQPLVELALQTPAWLFGKGGIDRSLERHAFADLLPQEVARRTFKGFINHHMTIVVERNARFLRELVLDGAFARNGYLDKRRAEHLMSSEGLAGGRLPHDVLSIAVAEAWIYSARHVSDRGARV